MDHILKIYASLMDTWLVSTFGLCELCSVNVLVWTHVLISLG